MGAMKAGVSIVTFQEKDSVEALEHAIGSTGAKGLLISPDTAVADKQIRADFLASLMPELSKMYLGDELKLAKFPQLKQIVQTGFKHIRGVNLFKDLTVYASPQYSSY